MNNLSEQEKKLRDMLENMDVDFEPKDRSKARMLIRAAYPRFPFRLFYLLAAFIFVGAAAFYFYMQTDSTAENKTLADKGEQNTQVIPAPETKQPAYEEKHEDKQQENASGTTRIYENEETKIYTEPSTAPLQVNRNTDPLTGNGIPATSEKAIEQPRPGMANISVKESLEAIQNTQAETTDKNTLAAEDKPLAASEDKEIKPTNKQEEQTAIVKDTLPEIAAPKADSIPVSANKETKPEKAVSRTDKASSKVKHPANNTTGFGVFVGANYLNQLHASRSDKYTITPIGGILVSRTLGKQWELGLRIGYLQQTMGGYARSSVKKVHHFGLETDSIAFSPQKLEYLQLGISLGYKIGKWQLYGGFYANNLLQASGNYTAYTKRPYKEDIVTERKERGYTEGLRTWHAVYGLGVGYSFNDFLRVSAAVSRSATVPVENRYYPTSAAKPYQVFELSLYYELFRSR